MLNVLGVTNQARPELEDDSVLDHWLEDSGRRTHSAEWVASLYAQSPPPPKSPAPQRKPYITQPELLALFAAAVVAYGLQYFLHVELTIASIRGVIVFVGLK